MVGQIDHAFNQSVKIIKTQGILSIVFGSLGFVFGMFLLAHAGITVANSGGGGLDLVPGVFGMFMVLLFFLVPNAYLLISGIVLFRLPSATVVRTLAIISMIVHFWNLILLAFSIVTLIQADAYQKGLLAQKNSPVADENS